MLRKRVDASRRADEGDEVGGEDRGAVREEVGRARQTAGLDPPGESPFLQLLATRDLLERQKGGPDVAEILPLERRVWPVGDESGHGGNMSAQRRRCFGPRRRVASRAIGGSRPRGPGPTQ